MTDKEQIIIDGVDVSRCTYVVCKATCKNTDCYYKQLQRKTAECEELKELLRLRINDRIEKLGRAIERRNIKIDKYKQALDEIEKYQKRNCETCVFHKTHKCGISCQTFVILNIINKAKDINVPTQKDGE